MDGFSLRLRWGGAVGLYSLRDAKTHRSSVTRRTLRHPVLHASAAACCATRRPHDSTAVPRSPALGRHHASTWGFLPNPPHAAHGMRGEASGVTAYPLIDSPVMFPAISAGIRA